MSSRAFRRPFEFTRSMMRAAGVPIHHASDTPEDIATEESNPVVLVHGYMDNGKTPWWNVLNTYLKNAGWGEDEVYHVSVGDIPLTTVGSPIETSHKVRYAILAAQNEHDSQVDIISHSMGGLAARWCVEQEDVGEYVDSLITLGSPHQSTSMAYLGLPTGGAKAMLAGSDFLTRLNTSDLNPTTSYTAIWSPTDVLIAPRDNAKLPEELMHENDKNIQVDSYGHIELVHHPDVFETVVQELTV